MVDMVKEIGQKYKIKSWMIYHDVGELSFELNCYQHFQYKNSIMKNLITFRLFLVKFDKSG